MFLFVCLQDEVRVKIGESDRDGVCIRAVWLSSCQQVSQPVSGAENVSPFNP